MGVTLIKNRRPHSMQSTSERDDNWSMLLQRVGKQRDESAFANLFDHFAPLIKGFCQSHASKVLHGEMADELVQEVMFKVWQKAPSFDATKAAASTWIYTVMRNCRIDMIRRYSRHANQVDILEADDIWDDSEDHQPYIFLQQSRNKDIVHQYLDTLPTEQATVLTKVYMEGKSHSEISVELDLPLGTVKSRVRLGFKKLQSALQR